ncbi:nucleolar and coiled-body phosphoprotein 1-like [Periophthalmus magnuspinnatus]|uniref:nucleolar and coiled-body phosphoprotein 1-like n=1 Tax=Periophthalmus magnuspinnatus TaxID=409849 RepID=UPI00145B353A|nr:nucleolar and coiled-body phosphoprotein 1-like [Periophthalmus magnuspinnatus]
MTASNPELIPLIYRHLKEHGFHTAAEELQKHSLQSEAPTSTTLLDIYSSWLRSSKRKTKPATSKRSAPAKTQTTPKKASPHKKKTDKATKQPRSPNKKAPTKQKKSDGKAAEKNVKSSKSKSQKKKADGGEDSDSDSSLDVEKWKRLIEQMTDADLAKVEALDALVAPVPKKTRVRTPRAKPKPKTESPTDGQDQQNKTSDESTGVTLAKNNPPKKSPSKKVPVVALNSATQNTETPVANVISTPKHSSKKEKRKATTDQATVKPKKKKTPTSDNDIVNATDGIIDKDLDHNEDAKTGNLTEIKLTDQNGSKKKKKKKKDATQTKDTTYASGGVIDKNIDGNKDAKTSNPAIKLTEGIQDSSSHLQIEPKKKKKKDATQNGVTANASDGGNDKNVDNIKDAKISNPTTEVKKGSQEKTFNSQPEPKKKKKKKKIEREVKVTSDVLVDRNVDKNTVEDLNGNLVPEDLTSSLNTAKAESIEKAKKKKKKKDKTKPDGEQTVTEAKINSVTNEGTCETTAIESSQDTAQTPPKKKKKKKDQNKEEETLQQVNVIAETVGVEENTQQIIVKKKSKKKIKEGGEHLGTEGERVKTPVTQSCDRKVQEETPEALSTPQTPGLKKKKHKLQTEQLAEAGSVVQIQESETPKKKKKTSSKNKETES